MAVKAQIGTPLEQTQVVDPYHLAKLRALSVNTVEELLGLIASDPQAVGRFLEVSDLAQLQADAGMQANAAVMTDVDALRGRDFALGARPPADVSVEDVASEVTFESYFSTFSADFVAGQPGTGADLMAYVGPVRDQGNRGTCVAHACCSLLECDSKRTAGEDLDLSEQFVYWNAKRHDGAPQQEGTFLEVAMKTVTEYGVCSEATWPYNPEVVAGNEGQGPAPDPAVDEAANRKVSGSEYLDPRSSQGIRDALSSGRPVGVSIPVYDNWINNPAANATGFIPMPLPFSVMKGGHAMCAVGFDFDEEFTGGGYFVLRNSWGTDWAPQGPKGAGYGLLPFEFVDKFGWEAFTILAPTGE